MRLTPNFQNYPIKDNLVVVKKGIPFKTPTGFLTTWIVKCKNCGEETTARPGNIRKGNVCVKSCKCEKFPEKDWSGYRNGRLLATAFLGYSKTKGQMYLCKCDCGNITTVALPHLLGNTRSCGCLQKEQRTAGLGVAAKNRVIGRYKREATKRGLEWDLSDEQFFNIVTRCCVYCGIPPSTEYSRQSNGSFTYNGVDRINNEIGYRTDNVAPCCNTCNFMKRIWSKDYFLSHISKIYKHSVIGGRPS
jgi:hypothetical protein